MNLSKIKVAHMLAEISKKVVPVLGDNLEPISGMKVTLSDEESFSAKFKKISETIRETIDSWADNNTTFYFTASSYSLVFNVKTRLTDSNGTVYSSAHMYVGKIKDSIFEYDFDVKDEISRANDVLKVDASIIRAKADEIERLKNAIAYERSSIPHIFSDMIGR